MNVLEKLRARLTPRRSLRGLASPTYDMAKQVVALLASNDYWSAVSVMSGLSPTELAEVSNKAIALGADPEAVRAIAQSLGKTEVIEVIDKAPSAPLEWWKKALLAAAGATAIGGTIYAFKRRPSSLRGSSTDELVKVGHEIKLLKRQMGFDPTAQETARLRKLEARYAKLALR